MSRKYIKNRGIKQIMQQEMITVPKKVYEDLQKQAKIDMDLLYQLMSSFKDIKEGRVRKVR